MLRGPSAWFGRDYARSLCGVNVPVVAHELGQWCAYPDFEVIRKFTGYLRPGNFEIFRDSLAGRGLLEQNRELARASGRFQFLCYKEEIEANLRTPGLAGFQLLDLHDYLGQGTALVGLLDAFWEPKSCATAAEFRRFCGPTVPLARLTRRVFTPADPFEAPVEIAHYGPAPLTNASVSGGFSTPALRRAQRSVAGRTLPHAGRFARRDHRRARRAAGSPCLSAVVRIEPALSAVTVRLTLVSPAAVSSSRTIGSSFSIRRRMQP